MHVIGNQVKCCTVHDSALYELGLGVSLKSV